MRVAQLATSDLRSSLSQPAQLGLMTCAARQKVFKEHLEYTGEEIKKLPRYFEAAFL